MHTLIAPTTSTGGRAIQSAPTISHQNADTPMMRHRNCSRRRTCSERAASTAGSTTHVAHVHARDTARAPHQQPVTCSHRQSHRAARQVFFCASRHVWREKPRLDGGKSRWGWTPPAQDRHRYQARGDGATILITDATRNIYPTPYTLCIKNQITIPAVTTRKGKGRQRQMDE